MQGQTPNSFFYNNNHNNNNNNNNQQGNSDYHDNSLPYEQSYGGNEQTMNTANTVAPLHAFHSQQQQQQQQHQSNYPQPFSNIFGKRGRDEGMEITPAIEDNYNHNNHNHWPIYQSFKRLKVLDEREASLPQTTQYSYSNIQNNEQQEGNTEQRHIQGQIQSYPPPNRPSPSSVSSPSSHHSFGSTQQSAGQISAETNYQSVNMTLGELHRLRRQRTAEQGIHLQNFQNSHSSQTQILSSTTDHCLPRSVRNVDQRHSQRSDGSSNFTATSESKNGRTTNNFVLEKNRSYAGIRPHKPMSLKTRSNLF